MRDATRRRLAAMVVVLILGLVGALAPAGLAQSTSPVEPQAAAPSVELDLEDVNAALVAALAKPGWADLPRSIRDVRHSGPTPATIGVPGRSAPPVWYTSNPTATDAQSEADPKVEQAFVQSIEAAHAGRSRVIVGGTVLLVDPAGRIWCVAEHTRHLLRCYDGETWTYRRADGVPAAVDEPAVFQRLAADRKVPPSRFEPGSRRDLNDLGRWTNTACADAAGNLHFLAACNSADAEANGVAGGGVHTLRPDGTWSFFRIYPADMPRSMMFLEVVRCSVHGETTTGQASDKAPATTAPVNGAAELVTFAWFQFSDPVATSHGLKVEPIPAGSDELRRQHWKDWTTDRRMGPIYLLRFDGQGWRFDRSSVGWGVYDEVTGAWPQLDGRVYLSNRFGLWIQWPAQMTRADVDRHVAALVEANDADESVAIGTVASMGARVLPALLDAEPFARTERTKRRLQQARLWAEKVARGEADAVPVIGGRWRFFETAPLGAMPDGRFAFYSLRATDIRSGQEVSDCIVFFDPADQQFRVRPIQRQQWEAAGYVHKGARRPPLGGLIDRDGGLWVHGGFRCGDDGRIERLVPPGLNLLATHVIDDEGRLFFHDEKADPDGVALYVYSPAHVNADIGPAKRPIATPQAAEGDGEIAIDGIRHLFRQPELPPPWSAWAVREREGQPDQLLRLDGPVPTTVDLPAQIRRVSGLAPLAGGCVVVGFGNGIGVPVGFWDGQAWDVAPDVATLLVRHGARFTKMLPTRVFATDTSRTVGHSDHIEHRLMMASDGQGGVWAAHDGGRTQDLWHFDGRALTDLWTLLPFKPEGIADGAVTTAGRGRAIVVRLGLKERVRPGGIWAIWRVTEEDLKRTEVGAQAGPNALIPAGPREVGFHPRLVVALGPDAIFVNSLWSDRQGWLWSPLFADRGKTWVRTLDTYIGLTPLPASVGRFVQGPDGQGGDGAIWCIGEGILPQPAVLVDVGTVGDTPATFARPTWLATAIPGMGRAARLAVAPDGKVYLLHEQGCSLLRLVNRAPPAATQVATTQDATAEDALWREVRQPRIIIDGSSNWTVEEVARRPWDGPRNDFSRIAFDETGVWFLPETGPLVRAPLPRPE